LAQASKGVTASPLSHAGTHTERTEQAMSPGQPGLWIRDCMCGGQSVPLNAKEPLRFECEASEGHVVLLHRGQTVDESPYSEYLATRGYMWELRLQLRFKAPVADKGLVLGLEFEQSLELGWSATAAIGCAKAITSLSGDPCYIETGVVGATEAAVEEQAADEAPSCIVDPPRPAYLLCPAWTVETVLETEDGEDPPALNGQPLPSTPVDVRQATVWGRPGVTYTLVYYQNNIDFINWTLTGLPTLWDISIDSVFGESAIHFVLSDALDAVPRRHFFDLKIGYNNSDGTAPACIGNGATVSGNDNDDSNGVDVKQA